MFKVYTETYIGYKYTGLDKTKIKNLNVLMIPSSPPFLFCYRLKIFHFRLRLVFLIFSLKRFTIYLIRSFPLYKQEVIIFNGTKQYQIFGLTTGDQSKVNETGVFFSDSFVLLMFLFHCIMGSHLRLMKSLWETSEKLLRDTR